MTDIAPIKLRAPSAVTDRPLTGAVFSTVDNGDTPTDLASGSSHLTLPMWRNLGGPMAFPVVPSGEQGSILTGMGAEATIAEYPLVAMIIAIINIGAAAVETVADSQGSPANTRFASAVQIPAGQAALFICMPVSGEKKWFPVFGAAD